MNTLTKLHKEQMDIYRGVLIEKLGVPELADAVIGTITTCKLQEIDAIIEGLTNNYPGNLPAEEPEDDYQRGWNEALAWYKSNMLSFLEEYKQSLVN